MNITREVVLRDIPGFEGAVEVDETYLGGQWKNKQKVLRLQRAKRGRRTSKQPVFGILCRHGYVWAEIVTGRAYNSPVLDRPAGKVWFRCLL